MMRYAMQIGKTPIFMSAKPNLFSDMYFDMQVIGMTDARPFLFNKKETIIKTGEKGKSTNPFKWGG